MGFFQALNFNQNPGLQNHSSDVLDLLYQATLILIQVRVSSKALNKRFNLKIFREILQRHKTYDQKLLFFCCWYVYKDVGSLLQYIFICCIRCDWRCVSACLMSVSAPPVVIMDTGDRGFYYDLSVLRCQPLPLQTHSQPTTIMLY